VRVTAKPEDWKGIVGNVKEKESDKMTHIEKLKKDHPEWDESRISRIVEVDCPASLDGKVCNLGTCKECWESEEEDNG
jgi:hypothetical protein